MSTDQKDSSIRPMVRYAIGSTLVTGLAIGIGWNLAYLTPVLALVFFAPGTTILKFKEGAGFVGIIAVTTFLAFLFTKYLLDYKILFIILLGLTMLAIFYTGRLGPRPKVFMLISLLIMPMLAFEDLAIAHAFTKTFILGAAITIVLVWIIYAIFPDQTEPALPMVGKATPKSAPSPEQRFRYALEILIIVFPVVMVFFFLEWSDGKIILIFITLLSMKPTFNYKAGKAMILGNLLGGIFAIVAYELVVMIPLLFFFVLMVLATSLYFATRLFSSSPKAPLFGMGFSTFLLIMGQSTTGTDDAGGKVWMRVIMIMIAVIYVVTAFGIMEAYKTREKSKVKNRQTKPSPA
jgi:hypothetical protein